MFNRNFSLLLGANILMSAAMPMLIILGGLAGISLAPAPMLATLPPTVQLIIGVAVAAPISVFMGRFGRQAGFALASTLLVVGGLVGVAALFTQSFITLCAAHIILGTGLICVNYFRFAAADAVAEAHKAQAMSVIIASGLVAALLGPKLFNTFSDALAPIPFAGAYLAIAVLGLLGAVPVAGLRLTHHQTAAPRVKGQIIAVLRTNPKIITAIAVAAFGQTTMVFLMIPTPLAMIGCGLGADHAADVIRWHVVAMFAPGLITGTLIARVGSTSIAVAGVALLLVSALIALSGQTLFAFYLSLITLGVGWNFGFVGGSHMLQSATQPADRPLIQGINEMILAICGAGAALVSGVIFALLGWSVLAAIAAALICAAMIALGLRFRPI